MNTITEGEKIDKVKNHLKKNWKKYALGAASVGALGALGGLEVSGRNTQAKHLKNAEEEAERINRLEYAIAHTRMYITGASGSGKSIPQMRGQLDAARTRYQHELDKADQAQKYTPSRIPAHLADRLLNPIVGYKPKS